MLDKNPINLLGSLVANASLADAEPPQLSAMGVKNILLRDVEGEVSEAKISYPATARGSSVTE
jgi:hypothetical protein